MKRVRNKSGNALSNLRQFQKPRDITWYVLANRTGASIYRRGPGNSFEHAFKFSYPQGHINGNDYPIEKPDSRMLRAGKASIRYSAGEEADYKKIGANKFAQKISEFLEKGFQEKSYTRIVLVAEAGFLGILRAHLAPAIAKLVVDEIHGDYVNEAFVSILHHLEGKPAHAH